MEQDNQLKQILINSTQKASAGFTDAVMKRVNGLSEAQLYYQPLVRPQWQRLFLIAFGTVIVAILVLCLIITLTNLRVFSYIQSMNLPDLNYDKILMFIFIFWTVFSVNRLIEKKFHHRTGASLGIRW